MSMLENYIGQNDNNRTTRSYLGFLKGHCDIIITSIATTKTFLGNWKNLDNLWAVRFLDEGKDLPDLKDKEYRKTSKKYNEKENLLPADSSYLQNVIELSDKDNVKKNIEIPIKDHFISTDLQNVIEISDKNNIKNHSISNSSHQKKNIKIPIKDNSISTKNYSIFTKDHSKNSQLINFCYDILQELDIKSNIHPFYKYDEKIIKNPIDLFTIISKLENNQYANIEEFEKDIRLIFRNCYKYNDIGSEMHTLGEELESAFNKIWTEKIIFQVKQKEKLKRVLDNDTDTDSSSELVTKQIRILEQNKDRLVYKQVVNDALLIASAYENLVTDNIIPFIELLKTFLSTRSQISLSSADEPVLQAIVENLLPLKYRIPELSLVMDSTKLKGFGRFGYSDIFVLKGIGNNNISLELKYISLIGLIKIKKKV
ncbi:Bdf1p [Rhizophagus irregularis DAOM 197198w]|uniref:Bdf1p n=1 Tax=Rhizophagus irregularis (strain DAOM 197198w) TaxID=1432141 RepID=A0A015LP05_RHIIW|nr:Bdf1p [Rhizophagus irregularis DAOM 197198w]